MKDRLKFRAFYKDFALCDDEKGDYTKSFMINNVSPYGGYDVGTYVEDFEDQFAEQGFTEDEIEQVRDYFTYSEYDDWVNFWVDDVEQCTSLRDKNGKLIYEGDIVKVYSITGVVVRDEYGFLFKMGDVCEPLRHFDNAKKTFEIIGNIHNNPELLEGVK